MYIKNKEIGQLVQAHQELIIVTKIALYQAAGGVVHIFKNLKEKA